MPFYFRIPLPGPFGYSKRLRFRARKRAKAYTHGSCTIRHRTPDAAMRCKHG